MGLGLGRGGCIICVCGLVLVGLHFIFLETFLTVIFDSQDLKTTVGGIKSE